MPGNFAVVKKDDEVAASANRWPSSAQEELATGLMRFLPTRFSPGS